MATINAPLLSLAARGQVGKALTFDRNAARQYVKRYSRPTDTNTPAQQDERRAMAIAIDFWLVYGNHELALDAWTRRASYAGNPLTPYNAFLAVALALAKDTPPRTLAVSVTPQPARIITIETRDLVTLNHGSEQGPFDVYDGDHPRRLKLRASMPITAGLLEYTTNARPGARLYVQLRNDGRDRSGIHALTVLP